MAVVMNNIPDLELPDTDTSEMILAEEAGDDHGCVAWDSACGGGDGFCFVVDRGCKTE